MARCKKCGGSGDLFAMEKGDFFIAVPFSEIESRKQAGYKTTGGTICCGMCQGIGAIEAD